MAELRERPELLARFDVDRSGHIEPSEWAIIERIITVEVAQQVARSRGELIDADAPATLQDGRYEIAGLLGVGGQGRTWLANDTTTDTSVAIKEMAMATALDWKAVELFEREATVLESLDHPAIPRYVDAFHVDSLSGVRFCLVQEFVDGTCIETEMASRRYDEADALALLREVCEILGYLHLLKPPVIHRDLKPSNLMRRRNGALALIDFGAVSTVNPDLTGGSTIVGTNGYMPIEQFMGRAEPRTDLYALGATVVHLLSRTHPADLPVERSRLQFADRVDLSDDVADLLTDLVAPIVDDRPESAQAVIDRIDAILAPAPVAPERSTDQQAHAGVSNNPAGWDVSTVHVRVESRAMVAKPDASLARKADTRMATNRSQRLATRIRGVMRLAMIWLAVQMAGVSTSRCGPHEEAMHALATCPTSAALLGENPRQSLARWSCGGLEVEGGCGSTQHGDAQANIGVHGSLGRGRLEYRGDLWLGKWTIRSARLKVDGMWYDVVPCAGDTAGAALECEGVECHTLGKTLPHEMNDSIHWDPCEGGPFTYEAEIDFEPCCDALIIGGTTHAGWSNTVEGMSPGPTTIQVRTDRSNTSAGVRHLRATCVEDDWGDDDVWGP